MLGLEFCSELGSDTVGGGRRLPLYPSPDSGPTVMATPPSILMVTPTCLIQGHTTTTLNSLDCKIVRAHNHLKPREQRFETGRLEMSRVSLGL